MHGRKKTGIAPTPEESAAVSSKVSAYQKLANKLLGARNQINDDPLSALKQVGVDMLPLQAQLLKINPDFSTLWNHRRELLLAQQFQSSQPSPDVTAQEMKEIIHSVKVQTAGPFSMEVLENELALTASCIRKQPKSYGAWHHRLWMIEGHVSSSGAQDVEVKQALEGELQLCAQFLELDHRNFHCWTYRKAVAIMAQVSDDDEIDYTMEKIEQNFSNYSAFHYRSKVLESCLSKAIATNSTIVVKNMTRLELIASELSMVCQAAFTEPEDQSAWWYHRFILDYAESCLAGNEQSLKEFQKMLMIEIDQLKELRDSDNSYKWAHVTLANTIACLRRTIHKTSSLGEVCELNDVDLKTEYRLVINALIQLDGSRRGYYKALLAKEERGEQAAS